MVNKIDTLGDLFSRDKFSFRIIFMFPQNMIPQYSGLESIKKQGYSILKLTELPTGGVL